jgi:hypothetical protein
MSAERHHESAERHEALNHLEATRAEKLAELRRSPETEPGDAAERAEAAREVIHKREQAPKPAESEEATPPPPPKPHFNPQVNYQHTLASLQRSLTPVSRTFSKLIHTPAVEKTSETLEKTVARPSVTVGATWTALIVGGIFYFTARHFGYSLSGSEMLFSFIVGAVIGLLLEGFWRAARGRRS